MCCGMLMRCMSRPFGTMACTTRYGKPLLSSYLSGKAYCQASYTSLAICSASSVANWLKSKQQSSHKHDSTSIIVSLCLTVKAHGESGGRNAAAWHNYLNR